VDEDDEVAGPAHISDDHVREDDISDDSGMTISARSPGLRAGDASATTMRAMTSSATTVVITDVMMTASVMMGDGDDQTREFQAPPPSHTHNALRELPRPDVQPRSWPHGGLLSE
jgi:hypothetical protein